jgi:hypothetical protein
MSTTTFVEATSADPFVRDVHRKAVRLLNDSSLDRKQREFHVRRLQSILVEHQSKQDAKAARLRAKKASRDQQSRENRNQGVAHPSQVVARRKEFVVPAVEQIEEKVQATEKAITAVVAANDNHVPGRNRPVLSLKRA